MCSQKGCVCYCLESLIKNCVCKQNPSQFSLLLFVLMAGAPSGPFQHGRGVHGQYVYAIIFPQPTAEVLANQGVKQPSDFDGRTFRELVVKCHAECDETLVETAFFKEPHANGTFHLNLLLRATSQYRWKKVADRLREHYKVHVNFGQNIRTWAAGVVYFKVASEHKKPEELDPTGGEQWHKDGCPTPFEEFLPRDWRQPGFVHCAALR